MTRIRYKKENNLLISKPIVVDGDLYTVLLDLEKGEADIRNVADKSVFHFINNSHQVLKRKVKTFLITKGAKFGDELRGKKAHEPIG